MENVKIFVKKIMKNLFFILALPVVAMGQFIVSKVLKKPSVTVLLLHDMTDSQAKKMAVMLRWLGYFGHFLSPDEFEQIAERKKNISGNNFLITFDDGFVSSGAFAEKYLGPIGIRAVFFVCPGFIGSQAQNAQNFIIEKLYLNQYSKDKITKHQSAMSVEQIVKLKHVGHKIGSHTVSHLKLSSTQNLELLKKEIAGSKEQLEQMLSDSVDWFAYPFGDLDSISPLALQVIAQNYKFNFTGIRGYYSNNDSSMAIWRECVTPSESLLYCLFVALGGLRISYRKRRQIYLSYLMRQ